MSKSGASFLHRFEPNRNQIAIHLNGKIGEKSNNSLTSIDSRDRNSVAYILLYKRLEMQWSTDSSLILFCRLFFF